MLPAGATLQSATLYIYVYAANNQTVNIHRITAPWDETTVTWNSFGGAFDATVVNSFFNDATGLTSVDVTSLVQAWLDGTYPNYGLLLDQADQNYPRAEYISKDFGWITPPYIEVCYSTADADVCEQVADIGDTYIWQLNPDNNFGLLARLYTGWLNETDMEKQSLLMFDIEYEPTTEDGCTWCKGCWRNHSGLDGRDDWITQYLPIVLGNTGGQCSIDVDNVDFARQLLGMELYDNPTNGIIHLYAQLLTTKLNIAYGASDEVIADVVALADNFLATHCWEDWYELTKPEQKTVFEWQKKLDDYNSGRIGPGHCPCVCDAPCDNCENL